MAAPLKPPLPGAVFIVASAVLFGLSTAGVKLAVAHVPPLDAMWMRFTLPAMAMGWAGWRRWIAFRPRRWGLLVLRGLLAALGVLCCWFAVERTSFSNFSVLIYTGPVVGALVSAAVFREGIRPRHGVALLAAFTGILLVMQPHWRGVVWGDALALAAGVFFGCALAVVREAARTETIWSQTMSFYLWASVLSLPAVAHGVARWTWAGAGWIAAVMALGTLAQLLETKGFERCSVAVGGAVSYVAVVVQVTLAGWLFGERWGGAFLVGAALIIGCGLWLVWDGARRPSRELPAGEGV